MVVVGGGLVGLSATRELARRGRDVVCLEQAEIGHDRAGSKGEARIFRCGYLDPFYVRLAMGCLDGWRRLSDEAGIDLVDESGFVSVGSGLDALVAALEAGGAPYECLSGGQLARRCPGLAVSGEAVYEPTAGIIRAAEVLQVLAASSRAAGGRLIEGVAVQRVTASGGGVRLETSAGVFECGVVLLCAGAWSAHLAVAAGLPADGLFGASLQQVAYFRASGDSRLPAFVERGEPTVYGLRSGELYKFGLHDPGDAVDPGEVSLADDAGDLDRILKAARRLLPELEKVPAGTERCFYDNTASGDFVIDRVGQVVLAGGTSGHGFKFAPLFGEVLADLAEGVQPALPIDRFRLAAHRT